MNDSVLQNVFDVMVMPLKRVFVLLWSIEVGGTSLGALILIGIIVSVLIGIVMHSHGFDFGSGIRKMKGKGD